MKVTVEIHPVSRPALDGPTYLVYSKKQGWISCYYDEETGRFESGSPHGWIDDATHYMPAPSDPGAK